MGSSWAVAAAAALLAWFAWLWKRLPDYKLARELPGKRWAMPILGHTYLFFGYAQESIFSRMRSTLDTEFTRLPYSKFWCGPQLVAIVTDASCVERVIFNRTLLHKGDLLHAADRVVGNGMLFGSGAEVKRRRRGILPSFKMRMLEQYLAVFYRNSTLLQQVLKEKIVEGEDFHLEEMIHHCSFDAVNETTLDVRTKCLHGDNAGMVRDLIDIYGLLFEDIIKPWRYHGKNALRRLGFVFRADEICDMLDNHIGEVLKRKKTYFQNERMKNGGPANITTEQNDTIDKNGIQNGAVTIGGHKTVTAENGGNKTATAENGGNKTATAENGGHKIVTSEVDKHEVEAFQNSQRGTNTFQKSNHNATILQNGGHNVVEAFQNNGLKDQTFQNGGHKYKPFQNGKIVGELDADCQSDGTMSTLEFMLRSEFEISDDDLIMEMKNIFMASSDTVAQICSFLFKMFAVHPEYQERAYAEVLQVLGATRQTPTAAQVARLEFLERCLKETLRLFPIAPFIPRKCEEPLQLDDKVTLPAGATLLVAAFWLHRSPRHWSRPDAFYPDHFAPHAQAARHRAAFLPFSGGGHSCIGQQYAMTFMKIIAATTLLEFRVEPADSDYVACQLEHAESAQKGVSNNGVPQNGGIKSAMTLNSGHSGSACRNETAIQDGGAVNEDNLKNNCTNRKVVNKSNGIVSNAFKNKVDNKLCQRVHCTGRYIPDDYVSKMNLSSDISVRLIGGIDVKMYRRNDH